jgi:hypothetical protein
VLIAIGLLPRARRKRAQPAPATEETETEETPTATARFDRDTAATDAAAVSEHRTERL